MAKKPMGLLIGVSAGPKKKPPADDDDPFAVDDDDMLDDDDEDEDDAGDLVGDDAAGDAGGLDKGLRDAYDRLCDAMEDRDHVAIDLAFDDIIERKMADR